MSQFTSPDKSRDTDATTQAYHSATERRFTQTELEHIFRPGKLSLGVHAGCASIYGDTQGSLREIVIHTSSSTARDNDSVQQYVKSAQSYQTNLRLPQQSFLERSRALAGQLASRSPFSVYCLDSAHSAFVGELPHVTQIRVSDFPDDTEEEIDQYLPRHPFK